MNASSIRRSIAVVLCAALTLTAPGLPAYAAVGQQRADASAGRTMTMAVSVPVLPTGLSPLGAAVLPSAGLNSFSLPTLPAGAAVAQPGASAASNSAAAAPLVSPRAAAASHAFSAQVPAASEHVAAPQASSNQASAAAHVPSALTAATQAAEAAAPKAQAGTILDAAFDGAVNHGGSLSSPEGSQGSGLPTLPAASGGVQRDDGSIPPSTPRNGGGDGSEGPQGPRKPSLWVVLGLGALGGAAAYFFGPAVAAYLGAHISYLSAHPLLARVAVTSAGALVGIAASQRQTWAGFPAALRDGSVGSATGTFKFWARFGLVFDSVLRGKPTDEAMKAPLTPNILRYPIAAWLFVLAGYACAPVAFTLGFLYKSIDTPVRAALRGLRQIALDFFPWLVDVARFVRRVLAKAIPFLGGLGWGFVKTEGLGIGLGAALLAAPIFKSVVAVDYSADSLPSWTFARLVQLGGIILGAAAGVVGGVVGLFAAIPFALTESPRQALEWARVNGPARLGLERWRHSVEELGGPQYLVDMPLKGGPIDVRQGLTRLANLGLVSAYFTPVLGLSALSLYGRAWNPASGSDSDKDLHGVIAERAGAAPAAEGGAFARYGSQIARGATEAAQTSWSIWTHAAFSSDAAIRGYQAASPKQAWLGFPAKLVGGVASGLGWVGGGLYELLAVPGAAVWRGVVRLAEKFWPTLKRFINFLTRVVKRVVPFVAGAGVGAIIGLFKGGVVGSKAFFAPFEQLFSYAGGLSDDVHVRYAVQASMLLLAIPALVSVVFGFAAGLVTGIPAALTEGAAQAILWAHTGERSEAWASAWQGRAYRDESARLSGLTGDAGVAAATGGSTAWRVLVTGFNALLAAPVTALSLAAGWLVSVPRGWSRAARIGRGEKLDAVKTREISDPQEPAQAAAKPWSRPPVWLVAGFGVAALAVSGFAPVYIAVFFGLLGWKLWLASAAAILLGGSVGLAVSQPTFWTSLPGRVIGDARAGAQATWTLWSRLGDGFAAALTGRSSDGSAFGWGHRLLGGVLALPWALAGVVYAGVTLSARAAWEGARQVVEGLLPFLRGLFETIGRILKRIVPFGLGLVGGLVTGVVGSAVFGALLLGRPYFKHVASKDFETGTFGQKLGVVALKVVSFLAGVGFGVVGLAAGVVAALPYALTLMVSMAFQFGGIGGKSQRFFDLWSKGSLRVELRRLNLLTDRFEFPEPKSGRLPLVDGWVRLANIFAATFAAALAATIAGYVSFFRSLANAFKDLRAGKTAPADGFDDMSGVSRSARTGAKIGRKTGSWLGGVGTLLVMGWLTLQGAGLAGIGKALLFSLVGWTGGWLAGLILGAALGFGVGLILWLARQLAKDQK
jgi:hypothetical protein